MIGYITIDLENKNIKQFITQSSFYKNVYTHIEIKILKLIYEKQILSFSIAVLITKIFILVIIITQNLILHMEEG